MLLIKSFVEDDKSIFIYFVFPCFTEASVYNSIKGLPQVLNSENFLRCEKIPKILLLPENLNF